jgi:ribosomal protein S4
MFNPNIRSVIPMKVAGLAQNDGSIHAAGRGAGLDRSAEIRSGEMPRLPYMNMTFAPTERRLDVAVWRAMFASSARQARQFVIHGYVKVNGQKV